MKYILISVLVSFTVYGTSQKTKSITKNSSNYYEIFDVLKKDSRTKHGDYKLYSNGDTLVVAGTYNSGQTVGIWSYFAPNGELEKQYDYDNLKITFYNPAADTATDIVRIDGIEQRVRLDWPAEYKLGENAMWKFIVKNLVYPEVAKELGQSGTVYITFFLTKEGLLQDYNIKLGAFPTLDNEALRVIKLLPNHWIPAQYNGQNVDVQIVFPVRFTIA